MLEATPRQLNRFDRTSPARRDDTLRERCILRQGGDISSGAVMVGGAVAGRDLSMNSLSILDSAPLCTAVRENCWSLSSVGNLIAGCDKGRVNATLALGAWARPHRDPRRLRWFDRDGGNDRNLVFDYGR